MHLCKPAFLDKVSLKMHFICACSEKITLSSRKIIRACSHHLFPSFAYDIDRKTRLTQVDEYLIDWCVLRCYYDEQEWQLYRKRQDWNVYDKCRIIVRQLRAYLSRCNSDSEIFITRECSRIEHDLMHCHFRLRFSISISLRRASCLSVCRLTSVSVSFRFNLYLRLLHTPLQVRRQSN